MKVLLGKKLGKTIVALVTVVATVATALSVGLTEFVADEYDPQSTGNEVKVDRIGPTLDKELSSEEQHIYTVSLDAVGKEEKRDYTDLIVALIIDRSERMDEEVMIGVTECANADSNHRHEGETEISGKWYTEVRTSTYLEEAKTAAKAAVEELLTDNQNTKVAILSYGSKASWIGVYDHNNIDGAKSYINGIRVDKNENGDYIKGAHIQDALYKATKLLMGNYYAYKKTILLLSSNGPTYSYKITDVYTSDKYYAISHNEYTLRDSSYDGIKKIDFKETVGDGINSLVRYRVKNTRGKDYLVRSHLPSTLWQAKEAQENGIDVYTIYYDTGSGTDSSDKKFINSLANRHKWEDSRICAYDASSDNIVDIFSYVADYIQTADAKATITDYVSNATHNTEAELEWGGFETEDNAWSYDAATGKITWNISNVKFGVHQTLTYKLIEKKYEVMTTIPAQYLTDNNTNGTVTSSCFYKDEVNLPAPTGYDTARYTFVGWKQTSGTAVAGTTFNMPKEDLSFVAQFKDRTYSVTFDSKNGKDVISGAYHYGDTVVVPADPAKAADSTYTYTFAGWKDKNGKIVSSNDIIGTTVTENAAYEAVYDGSLKPIEEPEAPTTAPAETESSEETVAPSKNSEVEGDEETATVAPTEAVTGIPTATPTESSTEVTTTAPTETQAPTKAADVEADTDVTTADATNFGLLISLLGASVIILGAFGLKRRNAKKEA